MVELNVENLLIRMRGEAAMRYMITTCISLAARVRMSPLLSDLELSIDSERSENNAKD